MKSCTCRTPIDTARPAGFGPDGAPCWEYFCELCGGRLPLYRVDTEESQENEVAASRIAKVVQR